MKRPARVTLAVLAAALTAASAATTGRLEIFSWWTGPGEKDGLADLINQVKKQNPGLDVVNAAVAGAAGTNAKAVLKTRMLGGNPPSSFQVHGGAELIDGWVKAGLMTDIDDLWRQNGWEKVFPRDLQDLVKYGGKFYAVPANIHRGNNLYYNTAVFKQAGLKPPTTLAEFFKVADALKARGVTPLALGSQGNWPITMIFENNLVAAGGPAFYRDLTAGKIPWTDARVKTALSTTKRMLSYTNRDAAALSWDQAEGLVLKGSAAMNIMGDWAKGYFTANNATPDREFSSVPAPGTRGNFVVITDTFGLPAKAQNPAAARAWLLTVGSKAGQEAFNPKKGSIPARTDVNVALFDVIARRTIADFKTNRLVPSIAHGSAVPEALVSAINDEMCVFAQNGDVDATASNLEAQAKDLGVR